MTPDTAAAIWHRLEKRLVARGLLGEGALREERAALIREIGGYAPVASLPEPPVRRTASAGSRRRSLATPITNARAMSENGPGVGISSGDTALTRRLDQLLDRACGYSGGDSVDYR